MVLSRVLGEQWLYGYVGAVWSHSLEWPLAVQCLAWFGLAWNLVHINDTADEARVFHTHQIITLIAGALTGVFSVRAFAFPRLVPLDFILYPWHALVLLGIYTGAVGGYLAVSYFTEPLGVEFPFDPPAPGFWIIGVTLALGIIFVVYGFVRLRCTEEVGPSHAATFFKYLVQVPVLITTTILLDEHPALIAISLAFVYIFLYGWAITIWRDCDAAFPLDQRCNTRKLRLFYRIGFVVHTLLFLVVNLTDQCLSGAHGSGPVSCSFNDNVTGVFVAILGLTAAFIIFFIAVGVLSGQYAKLSPCKTRLCVQKKLLGRSRTLNFSPAVPAYGYP